MTHINLTNIFININWKVRDEIYFRIKRSIQEFEKYGMRFISKYNSIANQVALHKKKSAIKLKK